MCFVFLPPGILSARSNGSRIGQKRHWSMTMAATCALMASLALTTTATCWGCACISTSTSAPTCRVARSAAWATSAASRASTGIGPTAAEAYGVYTHTHTTGPYRGAGRPEATYCIERLLDLAAADLGVDPFDLRRRNLVPSSEMPWNTGFMFEYDCGEFEENMLTAARQADLDGFASRRSLSQSNGKLRGIGISNPIEVAGGPFVKPGADHCRVTVKGDGGAIIHPGAMSVGQGLETAFSTMVAEVLGLPLDKIEYRQGDTDDLPGGRGSGGSASAPTGGSALTLAMDKVIENGRNLASELLETAPTDIVFGIGGLSDHRHGSSDHPARCRQGRGSRRRRPRRPIALPARQGHLPQRVSTSARSRSIPKPARCRSNGIRSSKMSAGPWLRCCCPARCTAVSRRALGNRWMERMFYDPDSGQPLTASFMDYAMPRADMLPNIDFTIREVRTKVNPVGAKGVGEAGSVGSMVAAVNAVCNALAPLGVNHIEMPCTPGQNLGRDPRGKTLKI